MNFRPLGYYNYTVILTYVGMVTGFTGIICTMNDNPYKAIFCLMAAGFCDMFDGAIAATRERTKQEKCFGIQIDSLSDLICFGVLPGLIVYQLSEGNSRVAAVAAVYALSALIRLSYFNVSEQERQQATTEKRTSYLGLPVTMSAVFLPLMMGLCAVFGWTAWEVGCGTLIFMALMFLTPVKLKKPQVVAKLVDFLAK